MPTARAITNAPRCFFKCFQESDYCYLPKKWVHSWSGHSKGVNAIRFFPKVGHLLLSAGMDGKVGGRNYCVVFFGSTGKLRLCSRSATCAASRGRSACMQ